ncbi:probable leucine-rich repeat receptor-like protein kinase At5g49770 [Cynara cardunculus var. scolymus]|uniref:probable leucine-rich repeat receptor-like protein kinase At5g49770 n=1 Tax=Cynara cardunculus var. scolymus TaxID=59895 RepID=UPI000D62F04E|nr:probable leucine-rich repeat receptor-like protein kinase At5g49770 [Cynara cardunculus var. scolymus]
MGSKIGQLLVIVFIQIWFAAAQNDDSVYLRALKDVWENTPPSWDDSSDPCSGWDGIRCTNGRVTSIQLASMGLTGPLPGDIGQLSELQILDLSYNKGLVGSLTTAIGNLKKLTNLILVDCGFSGLLPTTLGDLENLVYMSLNSNGFTGPIPPSIGNIRNLYWLDLADNMLTGSIPVSSGRTTAGLDMLTNALHFHLGGNRLEGDIPARLFSSNMSLIHLLFENNQLTGPIPPTLGLVKSLEVVRLDGNLLTGNVPPNINNLTGVFEMFLSNNQLTGPVPNLTGLNVLNYLDLSNNTFERTDIPSWFSTLQSLTTLNMYSTNLVGELPAALFSIPQLQQVDLSNNRVNGTLNLGSTYSSQLQSVNLQDNQIDAFPQRSQYNIQLALVGNPICFESGVTERFCSPLTTTDSSYFTPPNNCAPATCSSGLVSSPNCACASPYTGNIIFRAPSFSDLENGTIYEVLRNSMITSFRTSQLPVDSVSLKNPTKNLDDYLVIRVEIFPSGEERFNRSGIIGLAFSLSNQTFKPGREYGTYFFTGENYDFVGASGTGNKSSNTGVIVGAAVGGCVLVVLLVLAGMYAFRQKGRAERANQESSPFALWDATNGSGAVPQLKGAKSFSFEELSKYTNNFSEMNNIGAGGYGMVYRGSLPNGQMIAIKRATQGSTQGGLEFKTEIELLSRVHHKNLVSLVGFCFDQGEQMLVYEYIVNGTVKDSLSGRSGIRLDWMRRLRIALGAAKGLQYLHDLADPPIIHRDVKTNNILLDERLVAKVADFGLSKSLGDANRTHVTTQVKGTMGYMDPEYYMTQQLTEKSDVYSFGIVLLELITARNPIEKGKYIVREVKQAMDKSKELYNLQEVLDPTIGLSSQLKGLERFVDVALRCVQETGDQRPTMSDVVKEIENIMELAGLNPNAESASNSASYTDGSKAGYEHPYTNDSLFAYSGDHFPTKLDPK